MQKRRGTQPARRTETRRTYTQPASPKRRRRPIYKPDYARVRRIALAKRSVGILLVLLLVLVLAGIAVTWLLPALASGLEPSPITEEKLQSESGGTPDPDSTPKSEILGYDVNTGIPLYDDTFNLFVINADRPADDDFSVVTSSFGGVQVDERIVPALTALAEEAERAGIKLEFTAGYVSYGEQERRYQEQVDALLAGGTTKIMAREEARALVPAPGECDLQTGLCVTVKGDAESFGGSAEQVWLQNNMGRYGFVFRYPAGKEPYTGCVQNDLVIRYVGPENAAAMRRLSMCLEEYLDYLR
ncbi:MAG: D-alanyl-D-alanine carboxypeptidase family protein [Hominenteromicrobium sp.]